MTSPPPPLPPVAPRATPGPIYTGSATTGATGPPRSERGEPGEQGRGRLGGPGWLDRAHVTRAIIALNVCAFLVEVAASRQVSDLPTRDGLALGASYSLATVHEGRVETLVTACFLHAGVVHLLFNMVALWQAGPLVERAVGSARMAPMYLVAGVFGNLLSVAYGLLSRSGGMTVGASGAISGVLGAALVVYWRIGGWRNPMTQAMARWLGLVIGFGVVMNASGGRIDNAAHVGGALAGAGFGALWKRGAVYSTVATRAILAACGAAIAACVAVVAVRDRRDPFASMTLHDRIEFTTDALAAGRCPDAQAGLLAIERLGTKLATGSSLRNEVELTCGPPAQP